jgi:type I restriction enzyme, S subunit
VTGWRTAALGDIVAAIDYGVTASASQQPEGPKFLRITDIQQGSVDWKTVPWCACDESTAAAARLKPGDIVFARTGATTGKSFLVRECPDNAVFASYLIRVRLEDGIDSRYISHFFKTPQYWAQVAKSARGIAQPGVNATSLKALTVPLPPLPEQRRIAAILDKADDLRAKRRAALEQLDNLSEAVFFALCGSDSHHWTEKTVKSLAAKRPNAIRTGPFGSQLLHSEFVEEGIAVLGIDNAVQNRFVWGRSRFISERKYRQLQRYTVTPGDVLITIMGTCGRCAVVPDDVRRAINTKHLCCITLDQSLCLPSYLHACFLLDPLVRRQLGVRERGAVMPGLNMELIKQLRVALPPLAVQREHERVQRSVTRLRARQKESSGQSDSLFASLQHQAFTGEL